MKGRDMLITHTQVDELLSTLDDLSGLDEELSEICSGLIRAERYDEAVSRAFVVLEKRLRDLLGVRGGTGVNLAQKAFGSKGGEFLDRMNRPAAEVEGIRDLFVGAFRAYRNRAAHTVAGFNLGEARGIVHLVNLLLLVLGQVSQSPTERIPAKVAEALGPAVTERLCLFLERLKVIGIKSGSGKSSIPYRANVKYQVPSWSEPRPNLVAIFYLSKSASNPMLQFHSAGFKCIVGLDTEQVEADLMQAGCVRTAAKGTPIRLFLFEHNDQATFDRIYEILRALIEKHGV